MGSQWGDEGKGKVVDLLAPTMDIVVRFQGGANAGHTVYAEDRKFVLHLLPSGVLSSDCTNVIGNGCVVDPVSLVDEMESLAAEGVVLSPTRLLLSQGAHLVTPGHRALDRLGGGAIGTTGRGIGPCYADKARRIGVTYRDVLDGSLEAKAGELFAIHRSLARALFSVDLPVDEEELSTFHQSVARLAPYVADTAEAIASALARGKRVLYEGAQGAFLDLDLGTYPFVTSSTTTIGGAYSGTGVFVDFAARIAVTKAYTTRVGNGPFPTELHDENGRHLASKGHEFGATTGRPRRCGWLDLPMLTQSFRANGFNSVALTKLDCLDGLGTIRVAVGRREDGSPVYQDFAGWEESTRSKRSWDELPSACRAYVAAIEEHLNVPVDLISTGPGREEVIRRRASW